MDGLCLNLIDHNFFGILVELIILFYALCGVAAVFSFFPPLYQRRCVMIDWSPPSNPFVPSGK